MALNIKTRDQIVRDEISAIQAALPGVFSFPEGAIVRAIVDAHGSTALWEESLIEYVYARTRLATSTGNDVDTFVNDFGLTRLPAVAATGQVTFSSNVATTNRLVPVDAIVSSLGGNARFIVIADTSNPNYSASLNGYVLTIGTPSINVPVKAQTLGVAGNVTANTITVINSPITGVDNVTNALAFDNGKDVQGDSQLRKYFVDFINSRFRATKQAIEFAVESVQDGLEYLVVENKNYETDAEELGYFYVVADDGSGTPSEELLLAIRKAIDFTYRGLTIRFDVHAPELVEVDIDADVLKPSTYPTTDLADQIQAAVELYINLIPFGETLFYTRISQIIYNVILLVAPDLINEFNVDNILLNGATANLEISTKERFIPDTITINVI